MFIKRVPQINSFKMSFLQIYQMKVRDQTYFPYYKMEAIPMNHGTQCIPVLTLKYQLEIKCDIVELLYYI